MAEAPGTKWRGKGKMTEVGRRETKMRGTWVRAVTCVCVFARTCGVCYIKRPITINSGDAVYRGGTRNGINPRGLSADMAIMKRIGLLSVPEVRLSKVQSPVTASENITSYHNRYSRQSFRYELSTTVSCVIASWHFQVGGVQRSSVPSVTFHSIDQKMLEYMFSRYLSNCHFFSSYFTKQTI